MSPKVSIVVSTWEEKNKPYLDLCIRSIKNLEYDNYEVIVISKKSYQPQYDGVKTISPDSDRFSNEHGQNFAFRQIDEESKYIFSLNDDCVLTKNCLKEFVTFCGDSKLIINPTSNCDNGWPYNLVLGYKKDDQFNLLMNRYYTIEEFSGIEEEVMNAESIYPRGTINPTFLCTYATLIPVSVYKELGPLEETFGQTGPSDYDYCLRAQQKGIGCVILLSALVWHFGGATTKNSKSLEDRVENAAKFKLKWDFFPLGTTPEIEKEAHSLIEYIRA